MSDTPETDSEQHGNRWENYPVCDMVSADFARKLERTLNDTRALIAQYSATVVRLERERNEAREALEATQQELNKEIRQRQEKGKQLEVMREALSGRTVSCSQCNEAAAKLSTVYRWIERNHPDGFIDSQSHLQNLDRVADAWHDKLEAMCKERDELRDEIMAANSSSEIELVQETQAQNIQLLEQVSRLIQEKAIMREAIKNAAHFAGIILDESGKQWQSRM